MEFGEADHWQLLASRCASSCTYLYIQLAVWVGHKKPKEEKRRTLPSQAPLPSLGERVVGVAAVYRRSGAQAPAPVPAPSRAPTRMESL